MEIKKLREAKGMSQAELAKKAKVTQGAVCLWESGARRPSLDSLQTLSDIFEVPVDVILGRMTHTTSLL